MEIISKIAELPKIEFNFEELKSELKKQLESYKNIVVAEEVLGDCKRCQKDLASLRTKVDVYRKETKKELSKSITLFEEQCKELIALIEEVEKPIKEGIAEFDNRKKEEKRIKAEEIITELFDEYGLGNKYREKIEFNKSWTNLTAKASDVREEVERQVKAIKEEIDRKMADKKIVEETIRRENKGLKTPFSFADFEFVFNSNDLNTTLTEIYGAVERRKVAESVIEESFEENNEENKTLNKPEEKQESKKAEENKNIAKQETVEAYAILKIKGSCNSLKEVRNFMAGVGVEYEVVEQGML